MGKLYLSTMLFFMLCAVSGNAEERFASDVIKTSSGDLKITFIGHASLLFTFNNKICRERLYATKRHPYSQARRLQSSS